MLADVFENFKNMCIKIYELYPAKFLSVPGSIWQAALRKTKVNLDLLIDIDILLIFHSIYRYVIANNKYMKDYVKNKESPYLHYWDAKKFIWLSNVVKASIKKFLVSNDTSQFNENFHEESAEGYYFEVDVQYPENLHSLHNDLPF